MGYREIGLKNADVLAGKITLGGKEVTQAPIALTVAQDGDKITEIFSDLVQVLMKKELKWHEFTDSFWKKIVQEAVTITTGDPSEDHIWLYKICHRFNNQHLEKTERPKFNIKDWLESVEQDGSDMEVVNEEE